MFKKILLCLPKDSSYYPGLTRALEHLNLKYHFFDTRAYSLTEKIIATISQNRTEANSRLNTRLLYEAKKIKPDLLLVMKGEMISKKTITEIRKLNVIAINWFPDHVDSLDLAFNLSSSYDHFFHFDPYAISQLKKMGRSNIEYLPFACDILPNDPEPSVKVKIYPISFIGNYNSLRENCLKNVSDLGLSIWGDRTWEKSSLKKKLPGITCQFASLRCVVSD